MALPDSYTLKNGAIPAYFDAILGAEAPDRFSIKFLENLEFNSSNDRLLIGILKELGFLNADGVPQDRYFQYQDKTQSSYVLADGIREAYVDLFAVNKDAYKLDANGAYNKLRTLYKGDKKDSVIKNIAKTFVALCDVADFGKLKAPQVKTPANKGKTSKSGEILEGEERGKSVPLGLDSLQYHINIVLPDTRDQAVYDAIFKSLRDHLG